MSSSRVNQEEYLIPLEEIVSATRNFSSQIERGGTGVIFGGHLSERWQNRRAAFKRLYPHDKFGQVEFLTSVDLMCRLTHENIIPFIGYCDEGDEMVIVSEYANNQSLWEHLQDPDKRRALNWVQRLQICEGAAKALDYLHSGIREGHSVIHRNIKSQKILLNDDLEAKIGSFDLSILVGRDQEQVEQNVVGTRFYTDPLYKEGRDNKMEIDVYSFGVVMFEVLCGMFAYERRSFGDVKEQTLIKLVRRYYDDGLDNLIDPHIRDQISWASFRAFAEIAYQCISWSIEDRPPMNTIVKRIHEALEIQNNEVASPIAIRIPHYQNLESLATQNISPQICIGSGGSPTEGQLSKWLDRDRYLEEYLIPLEEILLATDYFSSENEIGCGGASVVYKGQLSERWQNRRAAFKHLHPRPSFGQAEFLNMVELMCTFNHENIIPFIGYCDEADEMIIVSEYADNQSLYEHIAEPDKRRSLTWAQRLKICLGAAAGLGYLHSGMGEGRLVLHRNIKPTKVLLDTNLEAKISSFNMSILVDLNQPPVDFDEYLMGTDFYLDPLCKEGAHINIESEIYSFGVVLFEVLSGMLAHRKRSVGDNQQQTLISLVRRYYDDGLDNLIDPYLRVHINIRSFRVFKKIAYQCISWNLKDRPTMNTIIKRIQEALDIQYHEAASPSTLPSHQNQNIESLAIPLEEILLATQIFSQETYIRGDETATVHRGQLSVQWQNRIAEIKRYYPDSEQIKDEFRNELKMVSSFHHENVIGFIGYCQEADEMIIVYDYAIHGSLYQHLYEPEFSLTWAQRLQICIGAARGLEYLHSCLGDENRVIHRDIKSKSILLDENLEAKISNFALSILVDQNQPQVYDIPPPIRSSKTHFRDPIYEESGLVNTQSDVYSFGMLMLEMLSGTAPYKRRTIGDDQPRTLVHVVRHYYHEGLDMLIDPVMCDEINIHSFRAFIKILYRCVSLKMEDRPTMRKIIKQLEEARDIQNQEGPSDITTWSHQHHNLDNFRISLKEINLAIKDFSKETPIGDGGYGSVYKAQLSELRENCTVAIKCLDPDGHQGKKEFLNEVKLISNFHHRNIISFVGYCDEGDQMIIVSKYAVNGSLDHHLRDPSKRNRLTWAHRLKICLGAAKGLDYLHWGLGKESRVIHRDVKSANILLDENMEAKICDFGLSRESIRNQQDSHVYTKVAGTDFYLDPSYRETNVLTKESDVYSFGVVLFELLSGMLAYGPQPLISLVRRYYMNEPEKLIDPVIRDEIDNSSFHTFKELAFRCISLNFGERPTMDRIIDRIEDAIDFQEHEV